MTIEQQETLNLKMINIELLLIVVLYIISNNFILYLDDKLLFI